MTVAARPEAPIRGEEVATLLLARGRLAPASLERARRIAGASGEAVDRLLPRLGLVAERDIAAALAEGLGLPLVQPSDYPDLPILEGRVGVRFLREHGILPLAEDAEGIDLAMADPYDRYAVRALALLTGKTIRPRVAVPAELEAALARLYTDTREVSPSDEASAGTEDGLDIDVERLKDLASEAPVVRLVNQLITRAAENRASDIHIEPVENGLRVRYRIDGVLQETDPPPANLRAAIVSRIKILARLNIAERRLPQDGRMKLTVRGMPVDLRVSTMPTLHGESVVLRVLDGQSGGRGFEALGLGDTVLRRYLDVLERPFGILLVTGPTGSGKTTTLYASLAHLNGPDRKIVTVEDPVEYQIEGINQIQVKPSIGLDFATVLRSTLRQDPDVILVGEIRDGETARIAVQAALTGHLVLSTLHTNNAAGAVSRLLDMGVEDYLLASVLNGVVGQRLVRRLCRACSRPYRPAPEMVARLGLERFAGPDPVLHRAEGCPECHGTGYAGRIGIVEIMAMSENLRQLAMRRVSSAELQSAAIAEGMSTMLDDGLAKAVAGLTTVEDVLRVTREV